MNLEDSYFGDYYEEYLLGQDIVAECVVCGRSRTCRVLRSLTEDNGIAKNIGPIDRFCAYQIKFGKIPPYYTYPRNNRELIYRYLTRKELGVGYSKLFQVMNRTVIVLIFLCISYLLIFTGLYAILVFITLIFQGSILGEITITVLGILYFPAIAKLIELLNKIFGEEEELTWEVMTKVLSFKEFLSKLPGFLIGNFLDLFIVGSVLLYPVIFLVSFTGFCILISIFVIAYFGPVILVIIPIIAIYYLSNTRYRNFFSIAIKNSLSNRITSPKDLFEVIWEGELHIETPTGRQLKLEGSIFPILIVTTSIIAIFTDFDIFPFLTNWWFESHEFYYIFILKLIGITAHQFLQITYWIPIMFTLYTIIKMISEDLNRFSALPQDIFERNLRDYLDDLKNDEMYKRRDTSFMKSYDVQDTKMLKCLACNEFLDDYDNIQSCENCYALYHYDDIVNTDQPLSCKVCSELLIPIHTDDNN